MDAKTIGVEDIPDSEGITEVVVIEADFDGNWTKDIWIANSYQNSPTLLF